MDTPYTRDELFAIELGAKPKRGRFCPKCKSHIPEFADVTPDLAAQLKQMHAAQAIATIREVTVALSDGQSLG